MPRSAKSKTIALRVALTEKLTKKYEQIKKTKLRDEEFGSYVNDLLEEVLEKDEFLKIYAPNISIDAVSDTTLYLKHKSKGENITIEIRFKGKKLYCNYDKSFDCEHIHYAFAIPQIAKIK
ncbi:MAG: hypothetical protein ACPKPY_02910 [Nitrososphaeraceae archaeon]